MVGLPIPLKGILKGLSRLARRIILSEKGENHPEILGS